MSGRKARARPAICGPRISRATACTASKSPWEEKGKPGLDDIHVEEFQVPGDLQFFVHVEIGAGGLFPVPQGRIEDIYFFGHDKVLLKNRSNISGP